MRDDGNDGGSFCRHTALAQGFNRHVGVAHGGGDFRQHTRPVGDDEAQIGAGKALARWRAVGASEAGDRHRKSRAGFAAGNVDQVGHHGRRGRPLAGTTPFEPGDVFLVNIAPSGLTVDLTMKVPA